MVDHGRRCTPVFVALFLALWLAACSSSEASVELGAPFSCDGPIDVLNEPPDSYRLYLGVVALPDIDLHQLGRQGPDNDPGSARTFAKMGLLVRSGAKFEIHVDGRSQGNAVIAWSNVGRPGPVSSLAIGGCTAENEEAEDGGDEWLVFPGGVWVLEPACVGLVVVAEDEAATLDLPVGEPCS